MLTVCVLTAARLWGQQLQASGWASIAAFMHLQYHFIRCSDFNRLHLPAKAWLLSTLGKSARCTLNPASVNGAHLFGPFSVSQHRSNLTANKGI